MISHFTYLDILGEPCYKLPRGVNHNYDFCHASLGITILTSGFISQEKTIAKSISLLTLVFLVTLLVWALKIEILSCFIAIFRSSEQLTNGS